MRIRFDGPVLSALVLLFTIFDGVSPVVIAPVVDAFRSWDIRLPRPCRSVSSRSSASRCFQVGDPGRRGGSAHRARRSHRHAGPGGRVVSGDVPVLLGGLL